MRDYKPIRSRWGRYVHLTADYRLTLCGLASDGWLLGAGETPDCKRCLLKLVSAE